MSIRRRSTRSPRERREGAVRDSRVAQWFAALRKFARSAATRQPDHVVTTPPTSATNSVTMRGAEGVPASEYGAFDVVVDDAMVRETLVTIDAPGCQ